MTIPTSRAGFFAPALISYLETQSLPYVDNTKTDDIEWDYNSDVHSPNYNPKGKVFVPKILAERDRSTAYKTYEIGLRLLISDTDENKLECQLLDWQDLIVNNFMFNLSMYGFTGSAINAYGASQSFNNLFLKIRLIQSSISLNINQSKGGTGAVISQWQWTDFEPISMF